MSQWFMSSIWGKNICKFINSMPGEVFVMLLSKKFQGSDTVISQAKDEIHHLLTRY